MKVKSRPYSNISTRGLGIARSYGSYSELIDDPEVECVYVGTINTTHIDVVMECLTKKKPVLCEKPLGMTSKETQRMVDLARENKVFLMEGESRVHLTWV